MKCKTTLSVDLDLAGSTARRRRAGAATDEYQAGASRRHHSGPARAHPHGEAVKNYSEEHVSALVDMMEGSQPQLWLHLTSSYPRKKDDFMVLFHDYMRRFARGKHVRRHVLAFTSGDWQRSRYDALGEKSWHIHAPIWIEKTESPVALSACKKWLRTNWNILDDRYFDVLDPVTGKRKQVLATGKKYSIGRVLVDDYNPALNGMGYSLDHHQDFTPQVYCPGRKMACRRKGICVYDCKGWEIFR